MASDPLVLRYAAFTTDPDGGNPAGVVIGDVLPSEDRMQAIAREVGYSETAFIAPRPPRRDARDGAGDVRPHADHDIRYFSPDREITFCGHATIATAVALAERDPGLAHVTFATRTELVPVEVERTGSAVTATLTSPAASHEPVADDLLARALATFGWDRDVLAPDLRPAVASAGASHLVLPVVSREVLAAMQYDVEALRDIMLVEDWTTVDVVWREAPDRVHARNPFPVGGVVEDPATGAAAAALGGYLRDTGSLAAPGRLTVLQGDDMGRPSVLLVDAERRRPGVTVGGPAVAIVAPGA